MTYNFVVSAPIICCSYENLYCNNASIWSQWHHCHTHQSLSSACFTAFSTRAVVILCQCPGISQCWLASSERTRLLQAMSYNYLYVAFYKLGYIFAQFSPRIILIWFIFCFSTFLCLFFCSLFPFNFQHFKMLKIIHHKLWFDNILICK